MTLENYLLAALSSVTSALCWAVKVLYDRLTKAEATVEQLRTELKRLEHENGRHSATVEIFRRCPQKANCPFYHELSRG